MKNLRLSITIHNDELQEEDDINLISFIEETLGSKGISVSIEDFNENPLFQGAVKNVYYDE